MTTGISHGVVERLAEIEGKRRGPVIPGWTGEGGPHAIALLAIKADHAIELWIDGAYIKSYGFTAASGTLGPKRRQGDGQIPEGIYRIDALNPKSSFHLSMRVDYPNAFDWERARAAGIADPGGDIYIHGGASSVGCIAVGDAAIEELFWIVARAGQDRVRVLIAPVDLRRMAFDAPDGYGAMYDELHKAMKPFVRGNGAAGRNGKRDDG